MHNAALPAAEVAEELHFALGGRFSTLRAPSDVMSRVAEMLAPCLVPATYASRPLQILVTCTGAQWRVQSSSGRTTKSLAGNESPVSVAAAAISVLVSETAYDTNASVVRMPVVWRDGHAIGIRTTDPSAGAILAAQLHVYGWKIATTDYLLLQPETALVTPISKLFYFHASSLNALPIQYRRALEASPWHSTASGIAFYAVDPDKAGCGASWSSITSLHGVVTLDIVPPNAASRRSRVDIPREMARLRALLPGVRVVTAAPCSMLNAIDNIEELSASNF